MIYEYLFSICGKDWHEMTLKERLAIIMIGVIVALIGCIDRINL